MTIDYNGIAILIGATAAAIPITGGFVLQVISFRDNRRIKLRLAQQDMDANRREKKIDELAVKVNGVTEQAVNLAYDKGKAEGTITAMKSAAE